MNTATTSSYDQGLEGLPTIQDQDILIYCMSMAMAEIRGGRPVPERVQMTAGPTYCASLTARSAGASTTPWRSSHLSLDNPIDIEVTNLRGEEATYTELFGIVDRASMVRRHSLQRRHGGALLGCSIVLSSWIREALEARRVLTLHNDYFRLRNSAGAGHLPGGA